MNLAKLLVSIDSEMQKIRALRPLSSGELGELQKSLGVMYTHESNALEGNTLTLGETKLILEDGITVSGKSLREINEAQNHGPLLKKLYDFVKNKDSRITEDLIFDLHSLVLRNIDEENAGKYRKIQVYISGDEIAPIEAKKVPEAMKNLLYWYESARKTDLHPVELAGKFHYDFVKIHPFIDGNGRLVRILMNMILMQRGYPMVIIPHTRRSDYIKSLHSSHTLGDFMVFFADIVHENCKDYLKMVAE